MPRIRSKKPQGRLTSESEEEPNNLVPSTQGSLRGLPARRNPGGLAQQGSSGGMLMRIRSHYQENRRAYNLAGAALGGFILGMLINR